MKSPENSFTSADAFPVKLVRDLDLVRCITLSKVIPPVHAQVIPTNECNLACPFCSCAEEDRSLSMSVEDMTDLILMLSKLGTRGITITGGGEPLLYRYLELMLHLTKAHKIATGLVTNGILLQPSLAPVLKYLTWCRISFGDEREPFSDKFKHNVLVTVAATPEVDWAFSYVVSEYPNVERIKDMLRFANQLRFTHVRLVADLLEPEKVPMEALKRELKSFITHEINSCPVIFQGRQKPTRGKDCYIGYLKPVISPDMRVYACCGVQYALSVPSKRLPDELCLGNVRDLFNIIQNSSEAFKGSELCERCYYEGYNKVLKTLLSDIEHKEFI